MRPACTAASEQYPGTAAIRPLLADAHHTVCRERAGAKDRGIARHRRAAPFIGKERQPRPTQGSWRPAVPQAAAVDCGVVGIWSAQPDRKKARAAKGTATHSKTVRAKLPARNRISIVIFTINPALEKSASRGSSAGSAGVDELCLDDCGGL